MSATRRLGVSANADPGGFARELIDQGEVQNPELEVAGWGQTLAAARLERPLSAAKDLEVDGVEDVMRVKRAGRNPDEWAQIGKAPVGRGE